MTVGRSIEDRWEKPVVKCLDSLKPSFDRIIRQNNISAVYSGDDVKQEILINLHLKISNKTLVFQDINQCFYSLIGDALQEIRSLKSYLRSCGFYTIYKRSKQENRIQTFPYIDEIQSSTEFESLDFIDIFEIKEVMYHHLSGVECRILEMSFFDNSSSYDISRTLWNQGCGNISPALVRQKKRRALKKLRLILKSRK